MLVFSWLDVSHHAISFLDYGILWQHLFFTESLVFLCVQSSGANMAADSDSWELVDAFSDSDADTSDSGFFSDTNPPRATADPPVSEDPAGSAVGHGASGVGASASLANPGRRVVKKYYTKNQKVRVLRIRHHHHTINIAHYHIYKGRVLSMSRDPLAIPAPSDASPPSTGQRSEREGGEINVVETRGAPPLQRPFLRRSSATADFPANEAVPGRDGVSSCSCDIM